jgi:hypothetical protein
MTEGVYKEFPHAAIVMKIRTAYTNAGEGIDDGGSGRRL